jgi:integrase
LVKKEDSNPALQCTWDKRIETPLLDVARERRKAVEPFLLYLKAKRISNGRISGYTQAIRTLETINKAYMDITKQDLMLWSAQLDTRYEQSTAMVYRISIKSFFKWLYNDDEDNPEYPAVVRWMKVKAPKTNYGKPVLTKQDIFTIMKCTDNPRDRAIIHLLYESGCRAGEFLNIRVGDVIFDLHGAVIRVTGKTGERRVRLVESIPDLRLWLNMHPYRDNPNAALWVASKKPFNPIKANNLNELIYMLADRAGLPNGISAHSFRHSRATHLAPDLTESQMKVVFGWTGSSTMPGRYVHLSGKDVDNTLLRLNGIELASSKEEVNPTMPRPCPRCKHTNSPVARFCEQCSSPLDVKTAIVIEEKTSKADEITAKVMQALTEQAPEILARILKEQGMLTEIQKNAGIG